MLRKQNTFVLVMECRQTLTNNYSDTRTAKSMHTQTQKTILIIEDEKSLRGAMVDILSAKGFLVIEARNGREGVEMAVIKKPDLIVLDLIMPEMDGMTALKKIREGAWGKKVPIIILTNLSATNEQSVTDAVAHKLTHYLIKSDWRLHDIVKKIGEILGA
jgi:CheY-like chemotaxis protein